MDLWSIPDLGSAKCCDLHADDGVDEEEHADEEDDVGQRLERLHERPQQDPDRLALTQQLHETSGAKQSQEAHVDEILLEHFALIDITLETAYKVTA